MLERGGIVPLVLFITAFPLCAALSESPNLPNIVFILVDDFGWADAGANLNAKCWWSSVPSLIRLAQALGLS